jgi:Uncharacterized conserved protein (DUF2075)
VYKAQGFEYDWNGAIIGPDLVWRAGRWAAVRDARKDPDLRSRSRDPRDAPVTHPGLISADEGSARPNREHKVLGRQHLNRPTHGAA